MTYRFVHAADIHLDSPLRTLALRDADLAELIGNATRRAFVRIIDLCLEEQVDALIIAGDLYDGDQTSMKTARFLAEQLRRLQDGGVRAFIVRGNHDALSKITKELVLPETVKVFTGRAEAVELDRPPGSFPIAIHGLSFAQSHAPESLLGRYKPAVEGAVNIGILHTSLGGAPGHDLYSPCSVADLNGTGFRYWALGHIHKRLEVDGDCTVVMPGMPQGRDVNEAGPKSVTLVTIRDDRSIHIEERLTSVAQFERVSVNASGIGEWKDLVLAVARALESERQRVAAVHLVVRLRLEGSTPLVWRMRRDADLLKTEADDRASIVGSCWIEKLEVACRSPHEHTPSTGDALSELQAMIDADIITSEAFQAELSDIGEEIRAQLPQECRDIFGGDEASFRRALMRLAREGKESVLARLQETTEDRY